MNPGPPEPHSGALPDCATPRCTGAKIRECGGERYHVLDCPKRTHDAPCASHFARPPAETGGNHALRGTPHPSGSAYMAQLRPCPEFGTPGITRNSPRSLGRTRSTRRPRFTSGSHIAPWLQGLATRVCRYRSEVHGGRLCRAGPGLLCADWRRGKPVRRMPSEVGWLAPSCTRCLGVRPHSRPRSAACRGT